MIELITNGALPRPAKCIACGYSGPDRWYFRFNAFIPRLGQILVCVAKYPGEDTTGCFNEAARRFDLSFMNRKEVEGILETNRRLQEQHANLEFATERFTDSVDDLVRRYLSDLQRTPGTPGAKSEPIIDRLAAATGTDGIKLVPLGID